MDLETMIDRIADTIAERVAARIAPELQRLKAQPAETAQVMLNTRDAAAFLGGSPTTLEIWRIRGSGPRFVKIGARVFYRKQDLENYVAENIRTSTAAAAVEDGKRP
ncbi:MAG TPA: helix-turn-helix domain-containing protein [Gallionellaceae bacterium]|nr:helix-turn-helix domain-containing protein [Gallionellaceae bacterium]